MAIATVNPATGETLKTFDPLTARRSRTGSPGPPRPSPSYRRTSPERAGGLAARRRRPARGRTRTTGRRADDHRDGQDARPREGRGRASAPTGCATTPSTAARDAGRPSRSTPARGGRPRRLRRVPADRRRAGGHAVELPAVAGDALRRPGADGRQRRPAQARQQRARRPRCTWRSCSAGPASRPTSFQTLLIGSVDVERVLRDDRGGRRHPHRQRRRPGSPWPRSPATR